MDYFFFDAKCKQNNVEVHWFFPIDLSMENMEFDNFDSNNQNVESFFDFVFKITSYTHVITHFVELCAIFIKLKGFLMQSYCS
jgi:hypothetical protein